MSRNWKQLGITALFCALGSSFSVISPLYASEPQIRPDPSPVVDSKIQADLNRPVRDKWALIVGISNFQDKSIPQLKYASKDAMDFYNYLIKEANFKPDHVRVLLDEQATQRHVRAEIGGSGFIRSMARLEDLVVVFFSTHGSPSQMDPKGRSFLVAYDSDPKDLWTTGVDMKGILSDLQDRNESERLLILLDACHSGTMDPNSKGLVRVGNFDPDAMPLGRGKIVLCSSGTDERSWESKRYQNGVFTKNLLDALRKNGKSTSMSDAFDVMKSGISDEVKQDHPGICQTPAMNSKWEGSGLILAVNPVSPQSVSQSVFDEIGPDSITLKKRGATRASTSIYATRADNEKTMLASPEKLNLTWQYFSNVENPQKAYQAACEAGAANFNNVDMLYNKAKINIQMQKWEKASQQLKDALVDDPNRWEFYLARGYCFYKMKQPALAARDLENAKFKNPTLPRDITFGD